MVLSTANANGEGARTDSEPVEATDLEAVCQQGIANEDDSLKAQCRDPVATVTDVYDSDARVCYKETRTEYFDG